MSLILKEETIDRNLKVFHQLKRNQKLIVNPDYTVHIDSRYFQFIRRKTDHLWLTQPSTRETTYNTIKLTYDSLKDYPEYQNSIRKCQFVIESLQNLLIELKETYANYPELDKLLQNYLHIFNKFESKIKNQLIQNQPTEDPDSDSNSLSDNEDNLNYNQSMVSSTQIESDSESIRVELNESSQPESSVTHSSLHSVADLDKPALTNQLVVPNRLSPEVVPNRLSPKVVPNRLSPEVVPNRLSPAVQTWSPQPSSHSSSPAQSAHTSPVNSPPRMNSSSPTSPKLLLQEPPHVILDQSTVIQYVDDEHQYDCQMIDHEVMHDYSPPLPHEIDEVYRMHDSSPQLHLNGDSEKLNSQPEVSDLEKVHEIPIHRKISPDLPTVKVEAQKTQAKPQSSLSKAWDKFVAYICCSCVPKDESQVKEPQLHLS
jgi:hypothetical protein